MKYAAFISYNSNDDKWARWLQRKLETYHLPNIIRNEKAEEQALAVKKLRVFRYRSDLNATSLSDGLAKELDDSNYLIVICSPHSAQSEWVGKEIRHFIDTGKKNKIIPFIVNGEPYSKDPAVECFNPVMLDAFPHNDMLGVNLNDYGDDSRVFRRRKAFVRIVSLVIDVPDAYNYLWNRYRHRWYQMMVMRTVLALLVLWMITFAWNRNQPFNCWVEVKETTPENSHLPALADAVISMQLDNEVKRDTLKDIGSRVFFRNIPGKYRGRNVTVHFEGYGYAKEDTVIGLLRNKRITLYIHRDDTYGVLAGVVKDSQGKPVSGASVKAVGLLTRTDDNGHFSMKIPIEKQVPQPTVTVSKVGFADEVYKNCSVSKDWQVMLNQK